MSKITVVIPTHDMQNKEFFLRRNLDMLVRQTFKDFDVVVTDNSDDDVLGETCKDYPLTIDYFKNPRKGMAQNTNEGIQRATGELVKIIYLDDFLAHNGALFVIANEMKGDWLVTGCAHSPGTHNHLPTYNERIYRGINTIGSPSVLTMKRESALLFDDKLTWLLDCDLYKRMHDTYGEPTIVLDINVVIGIGEHQTTFLLEDEIKEEEFNYLINKYE